MASVIIGSSGKIYVPTHHMGEQVFIHCWRFIERSRSNYGGGFERVIVYDLRLYALSIVCDAPTSPKGEPKGICGTPAQLSPGFGTNSIQT